MENYIKILLSVTQARKIETIYVGAAGEIIKQIVILGVEIILDRGNGTMIRFGDTTICTLPEIFYLDTLSSEDI